MNNLHACLSHRRSIINHQRAQLSQYYFVHERLSVCSHSSDIRKTNQNLAAEGTRTHSSLSPTTTSTGHDSTQQRRSSSPTTVGALQTERHRLRPIHPVLRSPPTPTPAHLVHSRPRPCPRSSEASRMSPRGIRPSRSRSAMVETARKCGQSLSNGEQRPAMIHGAPREPR